MRRGGSEKEAEAETVAVAVAETLTATGTDRNEIGIVFFIQVFPANCFVPILCFPSAKPFTQICNLASSNFACVKERHDRLMNKLKMNVPNEQSGVSAGSDIAAKFDAINSKRRDISISTGFLGKSSTENPSSRMPWEKNVLFIRHGVTEMNEYLRSVPYGSKDFVDPGMRDTRLTETGQEQARELSKAMKEQLDRWNSMEETLDLIVSSPLSRALDTAQLIFSDDAFKPVPRLVNPLVRERMWLSSDVGTPMSQLRSAYPSWEFGKMEEVWWYTTEEDWQRKEWRRDVAPEDMFVQANLNKSFGEYLPSLRQKLMVTVGNCRKRLTEFKNWLKVMRANGHRALEGY
eukprot:752535-Hanusia_phi.AAC.1